MTTQNQLEAIMAQGKVLPDKKITEILDELQDKQPSIYRFIYGDPSDTINLLNNDIVIQAGALRVEISFCSHHFLSESKEINILSSYI